MFDTLIDISLVNVTIHEGMFEVIETTVIKCLSLRYLTLSNNNMEEQLSDKLMRCIGEWSVDKVKSLSIVNNKLSSFSIKNLCYYLSLRVNPDDQTSK